MNQMLILNIGNEDILKSKYGFIDSNDGTCLIKPTPDSYEGIAISKTSKRVTIVTGDGRSKITDLTMCLLYQMIKDDIISIDKAITIKGGGYYEEY